MTGFTCHMTTTEHLTGHAHNSTVIHLASAFVVRTFSGDVTEYERTCGLNKGSKTNTVLDGVRTRPAAEITCRSCRKIAAAS